MWLCRAISNLIISKTNSLTASRAEKDQHKVYGTIVAEKEMGKCCMHDQAAFSFCCLKYLLCMYMYIYMSSLQEREALVFFFFCCCCCCKADGA